MTVLAIKSAEVEAIEEQIDYDESMTEEEANAIMMKQYPWLADLPSGTFGVDRVSTEFFEI